MRRLNYQHLFYFWNVAREGGIARACEKLGLAQPTISGQLAVFEEAIGAQLLRKEGRGLVLTERGRLVYNYAEEIFALGRELANTLDGRPGENGLRLSVGVTDAMPKLVAHRLLEPALVMEPPVRIVCYEDKVDRLLSELALHGVDLVLADAPATGAKTHNHLLGQSTVAAFAAPALAARHGEGFPASLDAAPVLLPTANSTMRRALDQWFHMQGLAPLIRAEIEDSALLKTFAAAGAGIFFAPVATGAHIESHYGAVEIGRIDGVEECYYAVTLQRKVEHPAIRTILTTARDWLA